MDQSQEMLLGHAIFASTVILQVKLAIKWRYCHVSPAK